MTKKPPATHGSTKQGRTKRAGVKPPPTPGNLAQNFAPSFKKFIQDEPSFYLCAYASPQVPPALSSIIRAQVRKSITGRWASTAINPREVLVAVASEADFLKLCALAGATAKGPLPMFPKSLGYFDKVM